MGITDKISDKAKGAKAQYGMKNESGSKKGFSVRENFAGVNQVAGKFGKGVPNGSSAAENARNHASAPLSTLKDPASFGPPPRHIARAEVKPIARNPNKQASYDAASPLAANPDSVALKTAPDPSGGWGAPLPKGNLDIIHKYAEHPAGANVEEEAVGERGPPLPYRADRTGISTAGLPKPPTRAGEVGSPMGDQTHTPTARQPRPPPPRLPVRQNSHPDEHAPDPPPSYPAATQHQGQQPDYLNRGAVNRLGQAGISVPGFNIGAAASPQTLTPSSPHPPSSSGGPPVSQLSELQSRFSKLPGHVSSPVAAAERPMAPTTGSTWAQKQAALGTASQFKKDPSSVSMSDMKDAGSTLNNFRQRHGDQVAAGLQSAQGIDQKYGVSGRIGGLTQPPAQQAGGIVAREAANALPPVARTNTGGLGKKPPPPPPPKKKHLMADAPDVSVPPPIPHASRPRPT